MVKEEVVWAMMVVTIASVDLLVAMIVPDMVVVIASVTFGLVAVELSIVEMIVAVDRPVVEEQLQRLDRQLDRAHRQQKVQGDFAAQIRRQVKSSLRGGGGGDGCGGRGDIFSRGYRED